MWPGSREAEGFFQYPPLPRVSMGIHPDRGAVDCCSVIVIVCPCAALPPCTCRCTRAPWPRAACPARSPAPPAPRWRQEYPCWEYTPFGNRWSVVVVVDAAATAAACRAAAYRRYRPLPLPLSPQPLSPTASCCRRRAAARDSFLLRTQTSANSTEHLSRQVESWAERMRSRRLWCGVLRCATEVGRRY